MLSSQVFTVLRTSTEGDEHILTMTNGANKKLDLEIPLSEFGVKISQWVDLVSEREHEAASGKLSLTLEPYDVVWLRGQEKRVMG